MTASHHEHGNAGRDSIGSHAYCRRTNLEVGITFLFGPFSLQTTICLHSTKLEISIRQLRLDLIQYFSFENLHFQSSFLSAYFSFLAYASNL